MNRPLDFLHVTTFYPPYSFGGDAAYVHRLAHALADAGHHVDVLHSIDAYHLLHPSSPEVEWRDHPGVKTHGLQSGVKWLTTLTAHQTGRPYFQQKQIQAVLDSRPYDVIHFHNVSLFGPGILTLNPRARTPVKVYTTHEHWLVCPTHVLWKFNSRACEKPDCLRCTLAAKWPPQLWRYTNTLARAAAHIDLFLAPSRFTAKMHVDRGFDRQFEVLPLFVDVKGDDWSSAPRPHERPYFLYVGRLERLKGVDALIHAAGAGVAADLLVVGAGSDEPRLRQLVGSRSGVHFLGALPQRSLGPLYGHALACCIPSITFEPFPMVAIEALARRTPLVAHDLGGLTEIVAESGGGILYRTHDELVAALHMMASDAAERRAMGERGYQAVMDCWSAEAHLRRYFSLLARAGGDRWSAV